MPTRLDPLESEIAARLRRWRRGADFSQEACAHLLGVSRDLYAAYEAGRTALPWRVYQRLGAAHRVNPDWLFSGAGTPETPFEAKGLGASWPAKARFSAAWGAQTPGRRTKKSMPAAPHSAAPSQRELELHLTRLWAQILAQDSLLAGLSPEARHRVLSRWATKQLAASPDGSPAGAGPVGETWPQLLARLRAATAAPRAKAALAKELGVERQEITNWIQGQSTPDGPTALLLAQRYGP